MFYERFCKARSARLPAGSGGYCRADADLRAAVSPVAYRAFLADLPPSGKRKPDHGRRHDGRR